MRSGKVSHLSSLRIPVPVWRRTNEDNGLNRPVSVTTVATFGRRLVVQPDPAGSVGNRLPRGVNSLVLLQIDF